jgi:hypothetical protein
MDLKETIISSFFGHLILFLLMLGLANFRAGFSGNLPDIISINLTAENNKGLPAEKTDSVVKPLSPSSVPADAKTGMADQAVNNEPREEAPKVPAPETRPAPAADLPKIDIPGKLPDQSRGSDSAEAYYQFLMVHRKIYAEKESARVNSLIGEALKVNTRSFYGGTAVVSLNYGSEGELDKVNVDSESPDLKTFLEEVGWYDVPAPASYLGHMVQIEFTVLEGYLSFRTNIL